MPSVDASGVSLYYEEKGSGQPVLFVHGIPTDYRAWSAQVEPFSKGHRVIAMSRRYASPNAKQGDVMDSTIGNNATDLKGFIEKLGIAPVHLVGHSYGGFIATYFAADNPDLIRSLVLVEPAVATLLLANPKSPAQLLSLLLSSPSVALSARRYQSGSLYPSLKALDAGEMNRAVELNVDGIQDLKGAYAKLPEATRKMMLDNVQTVGEQRTELPRFTADDARKISSRTMILNGEAGALWLRRIGELLARAIPNSQRMMVPGARHFPHMENAQDFNEKVLAFLGKQA